MSEERGPIRRAYVACHVPAADFARRISMNLQKMGVEVTSTWLLTDWETNPISLDVESGMERGLEQAIRNLRDVDRADTLVLISPDPKKFPSRGGTSFEAGYALKSGKRVLGLGDRRCCFYSLFDDWHDHEEELYLTISGINREHSRNLGSIEMSDIAEFHRKFGLLPTADGILPKDLAEFRIKFLREELKEYEEAVRAGDLEKAFDALLDLAYVTYGTAYLHGFPWSTGWDRVHEANMKKVRAERADQSARRSVFDVVKPAGWTPPDLSDLVKRVKESGNGGVEGISYRNEDLTRVVSSFSPKDGGNFKEKENS